MLFAGGNKTITADWGNKNSIFANLKNEKIISCRDGSRKKGLIPVGNLTIMLFKSINLSLVSISARVQMRYLMKKIIRTSLFAFLGVFYAILAAIAQPAINHDSADKHKMVRISGTIVDQDNKVITPGMVALFSSDNLEPHDYGSTRRTPDVIAFQRRGKFSTTIPPGNYYLGFIPRPMGERPSPPRKGEITFSAFTPEGEYRIFHLNKGEKVDFGRITVIRPTSFKEFAEFFTVTGKVVDSKGVAVKGSMVMAKKNFTDPRPLYISGKTGADGIYRLNLPPGKYYFIARDYIPIGGRSEPGSLLGVLGQRKELGVGGKSDESPAFIIGRSGENFTAVDIIMFKTPKPEERRRDIETMARENKIDINTLPSSLPMNRGWKNR